MNSYQMWKRTIIKSIKVGKSWYDVESKNSFHAFTLFCWIGVLNADLGYFLWRNVAKETTNLKAEKANWNCFSHVWWKAHRNKTN
jgi:hypothetical protein